MGRPVVIVADRVQARAVAVARARDAAKGPRVGGANREAWRSVSLHGPRGHVLDHGLGQTDVGEELALFLLGRAMMREAMACELVPRLCDATNQHRIALSHPAEREERRPHFG